MKDPNIYAHRAAWLSYADVGRRHLTALKQSRHPVAA
jgi:hypothetical protein